MNINLYTDKDVETLKEQIRFLEIEISLTASEKAEVEKLIREYEIRYNKELGDLIIEVLEQRRERLKKEAQENPKKAHEYKRADKEYTDFKSSFEESKQSKEIDITSEEQLELKTKFRRACQLCHPDKVAEEYKAAAHKLFIELTEAYRRNDLKRVSEILEQLEKGIFKTGSQSITEKEKLLILFDTLKARLEILRRELSDLKISEIYKIIAATKDFDSHFQNLRQQLQGELNK